VFLITKRLSDETSGFIAAFAFLAFNAADPGMMAINHRWDADTYAILGVYAIWRSRPALGGFLLALSFWATPVMGITALAGAGAAWLIGQPVLRVVAGGAAGALAGTAALWATGGLQGFIDGLLWARANYSGANRMAYGEVVGGYGALFGDAAGAELGFRALLVFGLTISAWLPVLSGLLILKSRDRNLLFLGVCGSSMILGMSPRFDIGHLIFAAPLFYPIAASFLQKARWTILPVGAVGALFLFSAVINRMGLVEVETPVGTVRTEAGAAELTRFLVANVKPGEKLFAYPYVPIVYFVTGARNVSRFAFLQPGFHTEQDERIAASDLLARPPDKVVFFDTPEGDLLRVWPASDRSRLKLRYLETFVGERYEPIARHGRFSVHGPKPTFPF